MQAPKDATLTEHSYGVIPVYHKDNEILFLIIQHFGDKIINKRGMCTVSLPIRRGKFVLKIFGS